MSNDKSYDLPDSKILPNCHTLTIPQTVNAHGWFKLAIKGTFSKLFGSYLSNSLLKVHSPSYLVPTYQTRY